MIGNDNNRINIVNRRKNQYQEINDINNNILPKPRSYYQITDNNINNINKNNFSSNNNSMNKQNVKMNFTINRNNISNNNSTNNNLIRTMNSSNQNNNINRALMVIKNEFSKKDEKIKKLELRIAELENKINMVLKHNNIQSNYNSNNQKRNPNLNLNNLTQKQFGKNFTFAEKFSEEINPLSNKKENIKKTPETNYNRDNNPFRNADNRQNINNYYTQTQSANQYKIKNNDEFMFEQKNSIGKNNNNINDATIEGSVITGNSSNFQKHSKNEVKLFLKEVKSKVDHITFKEFINNIKLLTNSKNNNGYDKKSVIEKVRVLFGERKDLFIKFQSILGFNN